jgi:AsmA protein
LKVNIKVPQLADPTADGDLKFLGVGNSFHAIMNSLSGEGGLKTESGVISGFDLDRLMRSGGVTGGTTVFDSLSATFTMTQGNLLNDDLLMTLPLAKAGGEGRIGLGVRIPEDPATHSDNIRPPVPGYPATCDELP